MNGINIQETIAALRKENAQLQSKCEEMRSALISAVDTIHLLGGRLDSKDHDGRTLAEIEQSLSSTPPSHLISKDQLKPIVEALEQIFENRHEGDKVNLITTEALQLARELGLS